MGKIPEQLARGLQQQLGLRRAVETGTYRGHSTRALAGIFDTVITIELSADLHRQYAPALDAIPGVSALQGDSRTVLGGLVDPSVPTLYFLDGHWSGGVTAGEEDECPVLDELTTISAGHADDCVLIDDARLFAAPPPPPHDARQWPTLLEVFDALRAAHPGHHITLIDDTVIAVPAAARPLVDSFGQGLLEPKRNASAAQLSGRATATVSRMLARARR